MFRHHGMHMIEGVGDNSDSGGTTSDSDNTATSDDTDTDSSAQDNTDGDGTATDWEAKYRETLAHSRKHEQRAKDNAAAAKKLADLEAAQMNDQQKADAAAQAANQRAETAERRAALLQAAVDHHLSKDDLELLEDVPADKIEAKAKQLAARLKAAAPAGSSGSNDASGDRGQKKPTTLTGALNAHYNQ